MHFSYYFITVTFFFAISCGGKQPVEPQNIPAPQEHSVDNSNVQIKGLWGKIDDSIIEETFEHNLNGFLSCYETEGLEVLEEIEGTLNLFLIVGPDGRSTDEIYFESGDLGSDDVQECMISKIKNIQFQEPIGGDKAKVRYSIPFEAPYDNPKPFDWSGEPIEKVVSKNKDDVQKCLNGLSDISLTLYVGRGGKVVSAGGSSSSVEGYNASRCLSNLAKGWVFKNPGKYRPAKASITF